MSLVAEQWEVPSDLLGSTQPRLFTPPLVKGPAGPCGCGCALTRETSFGWAVIDFARYVLLQPLDPWQEWLVIHAGELLPDGRPRFRRVLVLVARQNGKTHLLKILALYWLFVVRVELIVGTSTNLDYARESWYKVVEDIRANEALIDMMPPGRPGIDDDLPRPGGIREANGQESIKTRAHPKRGLKSSRYKIAAKKRTGGRSLTINRLVADELREQQDWEAYNASYNAMNAVRDAQAWFISNAGDARSVVLIALRKAARGGKDRRLGLFEWSAPDGANVLDPQAWAAANPNLGRRLDVEAIAGAAITAAENGGDEEAGFKTEVLCMDVPKLNAAIDPAKWSAGNVPGTLDDVRGRLAGCIDVSPDGMHATFAVAGMIAPGIARVEVVDAWAGPRCIAEMRRDLPGLLLRVKPRVLGWFPGGPAAAAAAELKKRRGWPPRGIKLEEIKVEMTAVCMGFAAHVLASGVQHGGDPLLDAHVTGVEKLPRGNGTWVFSRKGDGHGDAAYAGAGAVHLIRTMPAAPSARVPKPAGGADELARQRAARQGA